MIVVDLTGKRFGRLLVEADSGKRTADKAKLWRCRCDCGNVILRSTEVLQSDAVSCGCLRRENAKRMGRACRIDLTGKRFGSVVVTAFSEFRRPRHSYWKCVCDCGNEVVVAGTNLKKLVFCSRVCPLRKR